MQMEKELREAYLFQTLQIIDYHYLFFFPFLFLLRSNSDTQIQ